MTEAAGAAAGSAQKSGAPDPLIGRVIADRFKIVSLIARGGMGKVYRAEQSPLGRLCAIKVLNPNYNGDADPEFHRRFFREASITSKITHPNSVTIFDYGKTDDDIYFMAIEYLEGQTLQLALREGGVMHEVRVGKIASQICRALREAHKLGVIHRDLKPANIFLTRHGIRSADVNDSAPASEEEDDFVKVLDFGLVKHLSERPEEQLTQTGLFMGSPKYMAPEQIQGGHVDERTDIYSLGIIMYEMLAGKVPFERATSVNILMAHVGEPPPPMRAVNPNLLCSPAFEEIVMCCIAKDPNQRFPSMDAVLSAIRRAHGGSLTGQVAALVSGQYTPVSGNPRPPGTHSYPPPAGSGSGSHAPPPALVSSQPSSLAKLGVAASGSHTGMNVLRAGEASNDIGHSSAFAEAPRPRSKMWIVLGVLLAAGVGGGLGMVAFHLSGPEPTAVTAATAPPSASPLPPASTTTTASAASAAPSGSASSAAPAEKQASLHVTTDPPGASVREDNKELCAATPCDVIWKGEASEPTKQHKLFLSRNGSRPEMRVVKPTDPPLHVRFHSGGGGGNVVAPRPPSPPQTATTSSSTPNGFKDLPY